MGERTGISWTHHTFNPWVGCTKVSPACDRCYAESWAKRTGAAELWNGERRRTTAANWKQPRKWNRDAADAGVRRRVFCCSLADVFDNQVPAIWRQDLWELIRETPSLDWLMLTKRPQNIAKMTPADWGAGYANVWLGTTAENQFELDRRWPHLARVPATIRFLSCEPLLEQMFLPADTQGKLHWVIVGGESGHQARPMDPRWAAWLMAQARQMGAASFFKQTGSCLWPWPSGLTGKGDDPEQWPDDLRVQEFPA